MKKEEREKRKNWAKAKRQADRIGIVLTRRETSQGEYVCYLNRKSILGLLAEGHL